MKKTSLTSEIFDLFKAVITLLKTAAILLLIRLRNLLLIRTGLVWFFMRFSKITRAMKKCQAETHKTLKSLSKLDNILIARVREAFEKTEPGKIAVRKNPNRRLYAVLIPTKEENIQRIKNVFDCMSWDEKRLKLAGINYLLPCFQNINCVAKKTRKLYKAGKISKDDAIKTIRQSVRF
jgi:hypothetical protein